MATKQVSRAPTRVPIVEIRRGPASDEEHIGTKEFNDWMTSVTAAINGGGGGGLGGGAAFYIDIAGTLAIGSDLGPVTRVIDQQTASSIRFDVKLAPLGADLTVEIYMNAALWYTGIIPDGQTFWVATAAEITALGPMPAGEAIRIDITTCGTTFPGSSLTVRIGV